MIGLEFVCNLYGDSAIDVAKYLGIHRANVLMWFNTARPIPERHMSLLEKKFPRVPRELFIQELRKEDKQEIVKTYIRELSEMYEIPLRM